MPTYQYACTSCDEQLEVHQSFTDDALTECPACEGRLRKVFNAVGVVFKGSGFYKTDSRAAASSTRSGSAESTSSKESGGTDSGTSDSSTSDSGSSTKSTKESSSASGSTPSGSDNGSSAKAKSSAA